MLQAFSRWVDTELEGGEDRIFEMVAEGDKTMKQIAAELKSERFPSGISRGMLYTWIKAGGSERKAKFDVARELSAHGLVEEGLDILDGTVPNTSQDVSLAIARSNYRKWLASRRNREEYDEKQAPLINVSLHDLHLDSLRMARVPLGHAEVIKALPGDNDS